MLLCKVVVWRVDENSVVELALGELASHDRRAPRLGTSTEKKEYTHSTVEHNDQRNEKQLEASGNSKATRLPFHPIHPMPRSDRLIKTDGNRLSHHLPIQGRG